MATLSSQSSTSSPHLQLPTSPEGVPEQAMGGPPELDTASSSEGTGQVTISVLRPVETNTLECWGTMLSYPLGFKICTVESALLDVAFYRIPSSVALLDM